MQVSIIANIQSGKPKLSEGQRKRLDGVFSAREGKMIQIAVGDIEKARSNPQNRYYWGCVLKTISDFNGDTENDLHEHFKKEFAPKKVTNVCGKEEVRPKSTTEMTTVEFEAYMERIRTFAAQELQVVIPNPNE